MELLARRQTRDHGPAALFGSYLMFPYETLKLFRESKAALGPYPMENRPHIDAEQLFRHVAILREMMLTVHYYEESHWLAAAVSFRHLCHSSLAQDVLKRASTIAWQFGFPDVSHWINGEVLANIKPDGVCSSGKVPTDRQLRLPRAPDFA